MTKRLHIVCFDVPYPVSHGGFFDLFYKIKALKESGTSIHLHCFEYGRGRQPMLQELCEKVNYYPRKKWAGISGKLPFIVSSRVSTELVAELAKDQHPILFEGTHTTYVLYKNVFPGRKILYRLHNIEHIYYWQLFKSERNFFRKLYFLKESKALKNYEPLVANRASVILAVSEKDANEYREEFPGANVSYLPLFLPYKRVNTRGSLGDFALYHGNLSVPENEKTALLLMALFKDRSLKLVIAGRNPSIRIQREAKRYENISLKYNLPEDEMEELVREAQVNIVFSLNSTGIKVKLLHALFSGRHCVVNESAIPGEDFREFCHLADRSDLVATVSSLMEKQIAAEEIAKREKFLLSHFDNAAGAASINAFLP